MSSFRKRNVYKPISGTRTSPQTGQVITSSGNPSLDKILGGGLPIGSIILIEEDKFVTYSKVLAKYFLAEGIVSEQPIFLGSLNDDPTEMLRKLPKPLDENEIEKDNELEGIDKTVDNAAGGDKNGMRIAWRYNDLLPINLEQTVTKIGHHFNLMEQMDTFSLEHAETYVWNDTKSEENSGKLTSEESDESISESDKTCRTSSTATDLNAFYCAKYYRLLEELSQTLSEEKFSPEFPAIKSLCRICLTSLGSPLWYDGGFAKDILKFLTVLRSVVRSTVSVCFLTMPMHLISKYDNSLVPKIRNLVDFSFELESFAGSDRETNPAFKEYNGLLHVRKIFAINTLSAYMPETLDLAFKLRRKKFVIEKLHLPPELQENDIAITNCSQACIDF